VENLSENLNLKVGSQMMVTLGYILNKLKLA